MIDCLANTGSAPVVPLVIGAVALALGVVAVWRFRRSGARGATALLLLVALAVGGGAALGGPTTSAFAAETGCETTAATTAPAPAPAPEPEPQPVLPSALVPSWSPSALAMHLVAEGSFPPYPHGPAQLTVLNNTDTVASNLVVDLQASPAPGIGGVLVGQALEGDGWAYVPPGGGGHMQITWTGTLAPGQSTPPVTLHFGTDDSGGTGSGTFTATATSGDLATVPAVLPITYDQQPG
ncbi:hypothetical protein NY547_10845 [Cnuibacter physcomitrellae]|uniref:hypothetical protein n=1 Tax=Cnuibacter physcomitrellae TaxID=1619308 RepID=UPI002175D30D|nr:hypothetical protein [Cnuibacter physcomitrellae]MCS5497733.1 hypothetical protein [Cnuibacter physcomitrellae]